MKFAISSDWHLSRYGQDNIDTETNLSERLSSIFNSANFMVKYCRENGIKDIILAGDVSHNKSYIYTLCQSLFLEFIRNNKDINFTLVDGNHDKAAKGDDLHSFLDIFDNNECKNVFTVNGRQEYYDKENSILYVPYSSKMIDIIKNNKADYLISHFGLNEAILNSGISIVSDLKLSDLTGKYKYVLLGHYHKSQEIILSNIHIYYMGSIIQLDWGEKNDNKRFLVVDTETKEIKSVLFEGYKKFIELEINEKNKVEVIKEVKRLSEEGHHCKIINNDNIQISEQIEGVRIFKNTDINFNNRGIVSTMSEKDRLKQYLIYKEIPEEDHDSYINIGLEVYDLYEANQKNEVT